MTEIRFFNAVDLSREDWQELQGISSDYHGEALLYRSEEEVRELLNLDDLDAYYASHVDPNSKVGNPYNPNQAYTKPRVAVAVDGGKPVGFAESANNVSGPNSLIRAAKRLSVVRNYLSMSGAIIDPKYRGKHEDIADALYGKLLKAADPLQPPTTYVWPDEMESSEEPWKKLGFERTDEQQYFAFGEDSAPVREFRMQAPSVKAVLRNMQAL